jgi:cytochrome c-type biogenesis protein
MHAAAFVGGFSAVFIIFWSSLAVVGFVVLENTKLMREVAGAALIFMGLHLLGLITIPFLDRQYTLNAQTANRVGYRRSVVMGVMFAAGWTPCIGPVLGSIIGLALSGGSVVNVTPLLVAYSAGMGIPFMIVALAADPISARLKRQHRIRAAVPVVSGVLVIAVGVLMLTNSLIQMNQYFNWGYS